MRKIIKRKNGNNSVCWNKTVIKLSNLLRKNEKTKQAKSVRYEKNTQEISKLLWKKKQEKYVN